MFGRKAKKIEELTQQFDWYKTNYTKLRDEKNENFGIVVERMSKETTQLRFERDTLQQVLKQLTINVKLK